MEEIIKQRWQQEFQSEVKAQETTDKSAGMEGARG